MTSKELVAFQNAFCDVMDKKIVEALEMLLERLMPQIDDMNKRVTILQEDLVETKRQLELVISHINDRAPTIQDTVGGASVIDVIGDENIEE